MRSDDRFGAARRRLDGALLLARAGAGVVMLVVPGRVAGVWLGARSASAGRFVRAVGVRDLLLCAGLMSSASRVRATTRRLAVAADLVDAVIALDRAVAHRRLSVAAVAIPALGSAAFTTATTPSNRSPVRRR